MTENNKNTLPFIKWVGGKRSILDSIRELLPHSFRDYYEPFVGGGAVFFGLQNKINKAYLSDVNKGLINTYNTVKLYPNELICDLDKCRILHNKEFYYHVRDILKCKGMIEHASRFIYLNRAGFKGMYRVNKKGKFNVSYGYYAQKNILQEDRVLSCSKALEGVTITRQSYSKITPKKKDFVFLDPPYYNEGTMFTQYTKDGFGIMQQEKLFNFFKSLGRKGIYAMITHQDSPYIRDKYKKFDIQCVPTKRNIANGTKKDTKVNDLIIRNYT